MKYEFDNISTENYNPQDREKFENFYDNVLIEKDTFTAELDDKVVELHVFIEDLDMSEYEDNTDHVITLGVVPAFDSLSEKHQEDILYQFMEEDRERMLSDKLSLTHEGMCYGYGIPLHSITVKPDQVEYSIESAIAIKSAVSGLIGFELDKIMNGLGNNGWDLLADFCCDEPFIDKALSRYSK